MSSPQSKRGPSSSQSQVSSSSALSRPRLRRGTICQLNLPSGYGFITPITDNVEPTMCQLSGYGNFLKSCPNKRAESHPHEAEKPINVYFRVPLLHTPDSSCHTGFMTLQVGDTLEYICNTQSEKPRAIYTGLVACSARSTGDMVSYLNVLLSIISSEDVHIDTILQELVKAPHGILLILCHPNPDRKLILLMLSLAIEVCDQFQKTVSSALKLKLAKEFFRLLARSPFMTSENAPLCKLLMELQKTECEPSLPLFQRIFLKTANLQFKPALESEWGKPLSTLVASIQTLVLRILKELPEELPFLFFLIQTLNNMQVELQRPADNSLSETKETSFSMQVIDTIAHAKGLEVGNLQVSWDKLSLLPLDSEMGDYASSALYLPVAKVKGSYDSAEQYIGTYFRLLREDAFASLKKGLADFISGHLDPRDMTVWFGVSAMGVHFEHSLPGLVVGLQLTDGQANHSHPELPLPGSLLCICDNGGCFRNPIWATAARCELKSKKQTVLFVEVLKDSPASDSPSSQGSPWARILHASNMVVAESPAYYRAYEPVLKALQQLDAEMIPFACELVLAKPSKKPPDYLNGSTVLNWSSMGAKDSGSTYGELKAGIHAMVPPIPRGFKSILDQTQIDAVNHVIQHQLAMIQGPPGTGKTFLSLKIVELLLSANTLPTKPVLIVTYKNKALDQLLESCLDFCPPKSVVRVGGKCKSDKLAPCNLQNLLINSGNNKLSHSNWIANCDKLQKLQAELRQALSSLHNCQIFDVRTISTQSSLQGFLQKLFIVKGGKDRIMSQDSEFRKEKPSDTDGAEGRPELSQKQLDEILKKWMPQKAVFDCMQACFSNFMPSSTSNMSLNPIEEKGAAIKKQDLQEDSEEQEEYHHLWDDIKRVDHTRSKDREDTNWLFKDFLQLPDLQQHRTQLFKSLSLVNFDLNGYSWLLEADPWELSNEHRCILILLIMQKNLDDCSRKFAETKEQYDQVCLENAEINKQRRIAILREAKVIGMTTTGAAINQDILATVSPAIVLVEEAAEILEPHLMALLSPNVKHLILVGDHKQLRPSVECHQLQVRHNLGISMLERLAAHNQLPFQTLGLQSRMREEFLQMIKPIYPSLRSSLSVVNGVRNRPAKCMKSTYYFWNHPAEEKAARSPSNKREAYMVIALIKWLLSEGHKHDEISVICAYNGQVTEIRNLLSEHKQGEESVDVQTIDRFQGSENHIIIASLVRSNENAKIGHLMAQNRLCVTVSRARSGFYMCGNAETLSQASPHWKALIDECFRARSCLGENISLVCPRHPNDPPIPLHHEKAVRFSPDVCAKPCNTTMACSHPCTRTCHNGEHALCKAEVSHIFPECQHSTTKLCSQPATSLKCKETIWITLDSCGHKKQCVCWEVTEKIPHAMMCRLPCGKTLTCEHPCTLLCSEKCGSKPCKQCAEIDKIKAQRQKELIRKQIKEKRLIIDSEIKKLRDDTAVGPFFETLCSERETAAEYHMVKDRTEKFIQPTHSILPIVTKIEKVTNAKLQLNFLQAQRDLIDVLQPKHVTQRCLFCYRFIKEPWSLTSARPDLDYKTVRKNYDSVFSVRNSRASGGTEFDEYVIYNPDQALPKYVVHYKNMDNNALTLQTLQNKANLAFERRVLDASPSGYKGDTIDEMHFRFAEAQFFRMSTNKNQKVKKVELVWNQVLYDRYQKVEQQFLLQSKPVDEILVFHGTNGESIDKIVKEGFKVGGTDGVPIRYGAAYGHGVYTAANPDTSIPYSGGSGMMLLSTAICGKLGEDHKKGGSEDIYVVTKGEQLLPKYIVHFQ
ncbi:hypothetical protein GOP47_0018985 [Adiantum capillus-veneris]|uniref:PARP n=1 Tax=Adiantum capillus-veneris TaxID=13818 RepID=A0A9D4UFM0_ADICA|nr:hypothetical protein GOP47_0018985 [Adiantum capillus-veneris]